MQRDPRPRVTILDASIYSGSIGRVDSHQRGSTLVEIEKGVGRGSRVWVETRKLGPVIQADGNTLKILELMAPEGV